MALQGILPLPSAEAQETLLVLPPVRRTERLSFIAYHIPRDDVSWIAESFVWKEARNQGVAAWLIRDGPAKRSRRTIELQVHEENSDAIEAYRRMGFEVKKRRPKCYDSTEIKQIRQPSDCAPEISNLGHGK